jgi:UDP:flavonoid glycosyltransferase YjiC (YdhE family)
VKTQTIVFTMLNEFGHINPTFKLAKALCARGHDVRYLAIADVAPRIEAQGFRVEPLYPDLYPPGVIAAEESLPLLAKRRAITARYRAVLKRLWTTPPMHTEHVEPALMLIDVTQTHFALWAHRNGTPFVHVTTSLPQTQDPGVPPLRSGSPYGTGALARARGAFEWQRFLLKRRASGRVAGFGGMSPTYELARLAAPRFGVASRDLDWRTLYMPQMRGVAELVLCPESFDFPRPPRADRIYVESLDLARKEPEFPWDEIAPDKPLVYCALGSQRYRPTEVPALFRRLARVFRSRADWQMCLALGPHAWPSDLPCPPNVLLVERAPQLALLRRAQVMITHGGLGSVKECVMLGVPMLGVPLDIDQPGNVARVVHHGVGLAADVSQTTAEELAWALHRLIHEQSFRDRIGALRARFEETESAQRGADFVEAQLAGRRSF